jgi:hypothetical protein
MKNPAGKRLELFDEGFTSARTPGLRPFLDNSHFGRICQEELSPLFWTEMAEGQAVDIDQWIGIHQPHVVWRS